MMKEIKKWLWCGILCLSGFYSYGQCTIIASETTICGGTTIDFSVADPQNDTDYEWDLNGDGQIDDNGAATSYEYPGLPMDSTFIITLYRDSDSCSTLEVQVFATPAPAIGVPPGIVLLNGDELKACNGSSTFELEIFNASTTITQNSSYTIIWGDGSPPEFYDNTSFSNVSTISHVYSGLGYFPIFITAETPAGCTFTKQYTFYNGGNPSVGIAIPGNTVGLCAPATLDFPIINADANPPGTEYRIFINGEEVALFDQESLPDVFTYTFEESSCNRTTSTGNYINAFDIRIVASNPCNSSTATIEPIEVSAPPEPFFDITPPVNACPGSTFSFVNSSTNINEVISGSPAACIDVLNPSWSISGQQGDEWMLVSGNLFNSDQIGVQFLEPGTYTIEMTIISFACGPFTFSQTVTVFEPPEPIGEPDLSALGNADGGGCVPVDVPLDASNSVGVDFYSWAIAQEEGWMVADSLSLDTATTIITFEEGGSYDLSLTVGNACSTITWDTTIQIPGPPTALLSPLPDQCEAATLTFDSTMISITENGLPITSYSWTFDGATPGSSTDIFPSGITYDEPGTYIVALTTTNACGSQTVYDTFDIQVNAELILPDLAPVCASVADFQIEAQPAGGTWSGAGISNEGVFSPDAANIGSNTLTYSYGVDACQMESTIDIEVLPAPEVEAGPDQSVCSNAGNIELSGLPGGGHWTSIDNVINGTTFSPTQTGPGIYELVYTLEGSNGCSNADQLQMEVLPAPALELTPASFCDLPETVALPAPQPAGGTWSGPGVVNPSGQFNPQVAGGPGVYALTYTYEAANGCTSNASVNIGVISPEQVDAGPDTTLCGTLAGIDLTAAASPPGGQWLYEGSTLDTTYFDPMTSSPGTYQLTYLVGSGSCEVSDTMAITVLAVEQPVAGPDESLCIDAPAFNLAGAAPAGGQWSGPGITAPQSGIFDPASLAPGSYTLTYSIEDSSNGCPSFAEKSVVLHPLPEAAFSLSPVVCSNQSLSVINQSEDAVIFDWAFGDGQQSAVASPVFSYPNTGNYVVELTVTSAAGCTANATQPVDVYGPPAPLFTPSITENCGTAAVTFSNESNDFETTYNWDFGNGDQYAGLVPPDTISYPETTEDQVYTITLQAENFCGSGSWTDSILIRAFPEAHFGFTVDTGCAPLLIHFSNISTGNLDSYYWDFGNGQTSTDSIPGTQEYLAPDSTQTFPVSLIVGNACGQDTLTQDVVVEPEQVDAFFNISNTLGCAPFTIDLENFSTPGTQVSWQFGDGNLSTQQNPDYTFEAPGHYTITQYAWNSCDQDSTSIEVEVLPAPLLDFEVSANLCDQQSIQFNLEGTGIASAIWYFGNGDSTTVTNPVYSYAQPGTYVVRVVGTGLGNGCAADVERPLSIAAAPTAAFSLDNNQGCPPLSINFSSSTPQDDLYYLWEFDDGGATVEAAPLHVYTEPGTYQPRLTVTDERGCTTISDEGEVYVYPIPTAGFSTQQDQVCGLPMSLQFEDNSDGADALIWQNSGGWMSNQREPVYMVTTAGEWMTTQIAENTFGCRDTAVSTLQVYDRPLAEFEISNYQGCQPLQVTFNNFSQGNRFYWQFGDGATSTFVEPTHLFTEAGTFDVQLVAAYDSLCYDSIHVEGLVEVFPQPIAQFDWEAELLNNQPTGLIQFVNRSERATRYFWDFGDGATSEATDPSHRYTENNEWKVELTAWSDGGCVHDTLLYFSPGTIKGLHVPNAFSPDMGIGETKLFFPKGIGLKAYHIQIFSPYGQLLWESQALNNGEPAEGWDGTLNGSPLPQDVYVWKVSAIFEDETVWKGVKTDNGYKRVGSVTLLR
jgi:PKD repeat protein